MYTTVYYHTQVTMEEQTKAFIIQDTNEVCTVSTKEEYLLVSGISISIIIKQTPLHPFITTTCTTTTTNENTETSRSIYYLYSPIQFKIQRGPGYTIKIVQ
mmetsp:Transcript_25215/g.28868  ORF Transcript_25215/g.28868 Transcript_25215/m.28868 type:complete len:101 (+) Transcript_25215:490-792(+)